jgi:hypothetical protein
MPVLFLCGQHCTEKKGEDRFDCSIRKVKRRFKELTFFPQKEETF